MDNLAKLTDYKPAPTANMQKGGRRNKKTRKYYKRGGAYAENDNYDKTLDRLERGETVDKDSHPIDIQETTVFADDDEYDEFDNLPGDMKVGGSRRRKRRHHKKSKKRTHKRRKSGKSMRKTRR